MDTPSLSFCVYPKNICSPVRNKPASHTPLTSESIHH